MLRHRERRVLRYARHDSCICDHLNLNQDPASVPTNNDSRNTRAACTPNPELNKASKCKYYVSRSVQPRHSVDTTKFQNFRNASSKTLRYGFGQAEFARDGYSKDPFFGPESQCKGASVVQYKQAEVCEEHTSMHERPQTSTYSSCEAFCAHVSGLIFRPIGSLLRALFAEVHGKVWSVAQL